MQIASTEEISVEGVLCPLKATIWELSQDQYTEVNTVGGHINLQLLSELGKIVYILLVFKTKLKDQGDCGLTKAGECGMDEQRSWKITTGIWEEKT